MCFRAKNNPTSRSHLVTGGKHGVGIPGYVMQDVRWAQVIYWISTVAKGCVDQESYGRFKRGALSHQETFVHNGSESQHLT